MASIYTREQSPFVWIRFKDAAGKWKAKPTGFLKTNIGDVRQAKLLARTFTREEQERTPPTHRSEHWETWVPRWLLTRYGAPSAASSTTASVYRRYWQHLSQWLTYAGLTAPGQIIYRHATEYHAWRTTKPKRGEPARKPVGNNTAIHELKFFSVVMSEAVKLGYAKHNPLLRPGLKRTAPREKAPWSHEEIRRVAEAIKAQPDWMQATFLLGLYQAARLRQCEVPLASIDLEGGWITYWKSLSGRHLTKGAKPFTQPLDPRILPALGALVAKRRAEGHGALCEIPPLPSVAWRRFLDTLELPHLCHHGLRVTWITHAAMSGRDGKPGVTQPEARRFVNHGSTSIHSLYQKLNAADLVRVPGALDLPAIE